MNDLFGKFGREENYKKEMIVLSGEEAKPLVLAATGSPYLLIVEEKGLGVHHVARNGFDMDYLFDFIKDIAQKDSDFKKALADYIIDLSKVV